MKTLFDKIWEKHLVTSIEAGPDVLYIDKHLIHEVTSPQAFEGIEKRGINIFRPENIVATVDHNVPTENQHLKIENENSRNQINKLIDNCKNHKIELFGLEHPKQGIIHVIGPELGVTQPGMTMVCGDSHTSTHGAFGSIAFGIGTSEVEMVFASQCLLQTKPKQMRINVDGKLNKDVTAKDIVLYIIAKLTSSGATGYFIEFVGSTFRNMSMEGRMTVCNMSIEMGARGGLIAPDQTTLDYVKDREFAPKGDEWNKKVDYWKTLYTEKSASFDKEYNFSASDIQPMITYGTNPGMGIFINEKIPNINNLKTETEKNDLQKSLDYMGLDSDTLITNKQINYVFLGSCTNGRIEDLRAFANIVKGKQKAENVTAYIVPGSKTVEKQAIDEGIADILHNAGFKLRQPGCSACLAMNDDKIPSGEYCVSTSNRNFEGRQGPGARTILASPITAAKVAINGRLV
jgi:3-isopropylmalate/(R)-2-methylmalate dehydratase large subunit